MNNTKKAQMDLAAKMLKAKIDINEIILMSGLSREEIEKINIDVKPDDSKMDIMDKLDNIDFDMEDILEP